MRQRSLRGTRKLECSKCGEILEDYRQGKDRICLKCRRIKNRVSPPKKREFSEDAKKRISSRIISRKAAKKGTLIRRSCEVCGEEKTEIHHADYSNPNYVHWLCKRCHSLIHIEMNNQAFPPWKKEYKKLSIADKMRRHPVFYPDEEYAAQYVQYPKVSAANGLTKAIIQFLTWKGHYANRINTQGQARIYKVPRYDHGLGQMQYHDQVRYTKGTTNLGTPDISSIIYGRAVWIEVKIGNDRVSEAQRTQQDHIEHAGGLYYIAKEMQLFYDWYYQLIEQI